jgi:cobalt-zinc-cadmium efflux system protein
MHDHSPAPARREQRRVLWLALTANAALMVGEFVAAFAFRSLTLLADSVHLLTDVSGLAIAAIAFRLIERPATPRHSFGLHRAEVLAAQGNAVILIGASGWIFIEASRRLAHPVAVSGPGLLGVGAIALVINAGSAWFLHGQRGRSLNMRGAFLHLALDALASVGAVAAGLVIVLSGARRVDPAVSVAIGVIVLWAAWRLLRDATQVLLEGTPAGMDPQVVHDALSTAPGVRNVHHLHLWSLASDVPALSAHVVLTDATSMHDAQIRGDELKALLAERFGIEHATLELECHEHTAPFTGV